MTFVGGIRMDVPAGKLFAQTFASDFSLDLIKQLTVGQRDIDSTEKLSAFLNTRIFSNIGKLRSTIYLLDHSQKTFRQIQESQLQDDPQSIGLPVHAPLIRQLRETCGPFHLEQDNSLLLRQSCEKRDHLLLPLNDSGTLFGFIHLQGEPLPNFSPIQLDTLQTLAEIVGSRLRSMTTINQVKESMQAITHSDRLRTALYEISELAHTCRDMHELYPKIHEIVQRLIFSKNFYISIIEDRPDGQYLLFPYFADSHNPEFHGKEFKLAGDKQPVTAYVLKSGRPLLITPENLHQVRQQFRIDFLGTVPHSWLGAPFYTGWYAGAVAVTSHQDIVFSEKDKELIAFIARHIGEALKRKQTLTELRTAKERAEIAEKKKSAFLANMSHEIRTPMNGILGLTELVMQNGLEGKNRSYIDMVHSSAERLLKLINDILDFSKIEAGKFELLKEPFCLRDTIANVLEILAISAATKNISLEVACPASIPDRLVGDADKLAQILTNLVSNAIKFTNAGQVSLKLSHHENQVTNREELLFVVQDTGVGIPPDEIDNVFKAFSQLGTTRDSNNPGTGLGLVIAAELVELMGGKIGVTSEPNVGTQFSFTMPFVPASKEVSPPSESPRIQSPQDDSLPAEPLKILLVEDEYINRTLATAVLGQEGWYIETAENGHQALQALEKQDFDLVLMDVQMPEMDGFATTRAIRDKEKKTGSHLPIIAMTAYAIKGDREKCLTAGMDGYVAKPVRPKLLKEEIDRVLRKTVS